MGFLLFADVVLGVHEDEDFFAGAEGLLEAVVEEGEFADGIVEGEDGDEEGDEGGLGHLVGFDLLTAEGEQGGDADGADGVHERGADGLDADGAEVGAEEAFGGAAEALDLPALHAEGFDDAVAGDGFVEDVLDLGELVLPLARGAADAAADFAGGEQDDGDEEEDDPGEPAAVDDDDAGEEEEGEDLLERVAEDAGHGGLDALDVVDEGGEEGAGGVLLEERHGAAHDGVVEVVAEVGDHAEAGVVDEVGAGVVGDGLDEGGRDEEVGDDGPGVVHVAGHKEVEVELTVEVGERDEEDVVGWGLGVEAAIEDGLDQHDAKRGHGADDGHEDDGKQREEA